MLYLKKTLMTFFKRVIKYEESMEAAREIIQVNMRYIILGYIPGIFFFLYYQIGIIRGIKTYLDKKVINGLLTIFFGFTESIYYIYVIEEYVNSILSSDIFIANIYFIYHYILRYGIITFFILAINKIRKAKEKKKGKELTIKTFVIFGFLYLYARVLMPQFATAFILLQRKVYPKFSTNNEYLIYLYITSVVLTISLHFIMKILKTEKIFLIKKVYLYAKNICNNNCRNKI